MAPEPRATDGAVKVQKYYTKRHTYILPARKSDLSCLLQRMKSNLLTDMEIWIKWIRFVINRTKMPGRGEGPGIKLFQMRSLRKTDVQGIQVLLDGGVDSE